MATDGITFQITVHKSERDACRKWAKHAEMRCELLTWALKGHHAPAKLRTLQEERDILAEEQVRYRNLGQEHQTSAEELELEKASYAATVPDLARVFQDDDGRVHHLSSEDSDEETIARLERAALARRTRKRCPPGQCADPQPTQRRRDPDEDRDRSGPDGASRSRWPGSDSYAPSASARPAGSPSSGRTPSRGAGPSRSRPAASRPSGGTTRPGAPTTWTPGGTSNLLNDMARA